MVMFVEPALWIQYVVSGKKHAQNSGCPEIIKGPSLTVWREKREGKEVERTRAKAWEDNQKTVKGNATQ